MQPQCPRQLSDCGAIQRSVDIFATRFEGIIDFDRRWTFPRRPVPAFFKEFPDQVIKHARKPQGDLVFW